MIILTVVGFCFICWGLMLLWMIGGGFENTCAVRKK